MGQKWSNLPIYFTYFYSTRWFDITTFASNAPKQQEAGKVTASGSPPFACKYHKPYIQPIWERPHPYSGHNRSECDASFWFRYVNLSNMIVWHYCVCPQSSKTVRSSQHNGIWPSEVGEHSRRLSYWHWDDIRGRLYRFYARQPTSESWWRAPLAVPTTWKIWCGA